MADALIDAGPIIALFNGSDVHHQRCVTWLEHFQGDLLTTTSVVAEVSHILYRRVGIDCSVACLKWIHEVMEVDGGVMDMKRSIAIIEKYADLPADFSDAGLVALADRLELYRVATIDEDFTIYRGAAKQPFEIIL